MKPRHLFLLVILLALGLWNLHRMTTRHAAPSPSTTDNSPWGLFDHAAALRDDHSPQFDHSLAALNTSLDHPAPAVASAQLQDLQGCRMWLLYYRHAGAAAANPASGKPADWNALAREHVDSCVAHHQDIAR